MTWTVEMFPEELAFIDEVFGKKIDNHDGRGEFIAPLRGGLIMLQPFVDSGLTEEQMKWIVFNQLQSPVYQVPGFVGIKFMNFNWNGPVPPVEEDAESMDKWGTNRQTREGQPIGAHGYPIERIATKEIVYKQLKWDDENKAFTVIYENSGSGPEVEDLNTRKALSSRILE